MKKLIFYLFFSLIFVPSALQGAEESKVRQFQGSGEVVTVDPVYSQVTIQHSSIKGFSGGGDGDFYVTDAAFLKGIHKGDLVEFEITDDKGDARISKITKVGVAPPKDESSPVGEALQGVLHGTGQVVRNVTEPIPAAHEVVGGAVGATTDAAGNALKDATPEAKTKF